MALRGHGLNSMQLQIQGLYAETVFQFDKEWKKNMTYLEEIVAAVEQQVAQASSKERYLGLVCPPSENRAKRERKEQMGFTPKQRFFTPYAVQSMSRLQNAPSLALPDVTPVGRRKKGDSSAVDMERSSISNSRKVRPVQRQDENESDERGNVRRSMRLNGKEPEITTVTTPPKIKQRRLENGTPRQPLDQVRDNNGVRRSMRLAENSARQSVDSELWLTTPPKLRQRRERKLEEAKELEKEKEVSVVEQEPVEEEEFSRRRGRSSSRISEVPAPVEIVSEKKLRRSSRRASEAVSIEAAKEEDFRAPLPVAAPTRKSSKRVTRSSRESEDDQSQQDDELEAVKEDRKSKKRSTSSATRKESTVELERRTKKSVVEEAVQEEQEEEEDVAPRPRKTTSKKLSDDIVAKEKKGSGRSRKQKEQQEEEEEEAAPVMIEEQEPEPEPEPLKKTNKKTSDAKEKKGSSRARKGEDEEPEKKKTTAPLVPKLDTAKIATAPVSKEPRATRTSSRLARVAPEEPKAATSSKTNEVEIQAKTTDIESLAAALTPRKTVGKRVAQLMGNFEPEVSAAPVKAASPVVCPAEVEEAPVTICLTKEEGIDLSSRLEAIANGALEVVSERLAKPASGKRKPPTNERALAWSSRRGVTHNSLRDMLAANGIVRPDAGEQTIEQTLGDIPEAVGEMGTDDVNVSVAEAPAPAVIAAVAAPAMTVPVLSKTLQRVQEDEEDESGVSDSEDAPVPPASAEKLPFEDPFASFVTPVASPAAPVAAFAPSVEPKSEQSIQDLQNRIAGLKKMVAASSASTSATATSSSAQSEVASKLLQAPLDVSLNLGSTFFKSMNMDDDGDAEESYSLVEGKKGVAPGLFTREFSTPDKRVLQELKDEAAPEPPKPGPVQPIPAASKSQDEGSVFSTFMDGSFMGDSEVYNSVDAAKARSAVQFLEQIQLNGDVEMSLQNITITCEELSPSCSADLCSSPLIDRASSNPRKRSAEDEIEQGRSKTVNISAISPPVVQVPAPQDAVPQQPKVAKLTSAATHVKAATPVVVPSASTVDKFAQAKQRREKLEEEERKRKEEAVRLRAEREQRAKALKEGRAQAAQMNVAEPPKPKPAPEPVKKTEGSKIIPKPIVDYAKSKTTTREGIIEKGKRNAEKLKLEKMEELRRKKGQQQPTIQSVASSSSAVTSTATPTGDANKKKFNPLFGILGKKTAPQQQPPPQPPQQEDHRKLPAPVFSSQAQSAPAKDPATPNMGKRVSPRPSPLRKAVARQQDILSPSTTQYSISPCKASDVEGGDTATATKKHKREAKWAKKDVLFNTLRGQLLLDADEVFGAPVGLTCDLKEVFPDYRPQKKRQARTSSAHWSDAGGMAKPTF